MEQSVDESIKQAQAEYGSGAELLDAEQVIASLRKKYFKYS